MPRLDLVPTNEVQINSQTISRFRLSYMREFGGSTKGDALYEAISEGRRFAGFEHWLPLFHEQLGTVFDFLPDDVTLVLDSQVREAASERLTLIADYYEARREAMQEQGAYKPLASNALYLTAEEWEGLGQSHALVQLSPFAETGSNVIDLGGRLGRSFAAERLEEGSNVFDALTRHVQDLQEHGKKVVIAAWSPVRANALPVF